MGYRDYVIRSFNQDKPYDQFIREQIAGDLLPAKTTSRRDELTIATGFLAMGPKSLNERNRRRFKMDVVDEQIDVTTRAIMGLTVSCARCHDHKFDPIPTRDYYALAGIFASTQTYYGIRAGQGNRQPSTLIALKTNAKKQVAKASPKPAVPKNATGGNAKRAKQQKQLRKLRTQLRTAQRKRRALAGNKAGAKKKKRAGKKKRGRKKKAKAKKAAKVKKNAKGQPQAKPKNGGKKTNANRARQIAALDKEIQMLRRRVRRLNRLVGGKKKGRRRRGRPAPTGPSAMGVADAKIADTRIHIRGDVQRLGKSVQRGFLQVVHYDSAPSVNRQQSGRLQLAHWLSHPDNPLTARVMVNRVWMHLFGQGIVRTTDNFGATGERPINQELLDHLARRLIKGGWSTKKLVRTIVLSRTYQLSSQYNDTNFKVDPENRLNWRTSHRRLDAEAIRDAVLSASGQLDLTPRKRSVIAELGSTNIGRNQQQVRRLNAVSRNRSVYLPIVRNLVPGMLRAFDFAESSMLVGRRDVTTVPRQALYMMNNPFILQQSRRMAQRLVDQKSLNNEQRIALAFQLTYSRPPKANELSLSKKLVADFRRELKDKGNSENGQQVAGWAQLCQALFASAEFQCID